MGFVKQSEPIELWLSASAESFVQLDERKYRMTVRTWQSIFAPSLLVDRGVLHGTAAMDAADRQLPCDVTIFSLPYYRGIPGFEGGPLAYAYFAQSLRYIDRETANQCDAIVIGEAPNRFCCMYTHEWNALALPRFVAVLSEEAGLECAPE